MSNWRNFLIRSLIPHDEQDAACSSSGQHSTGDQEISDNDESYMARVECALENKSVWQDFHKLGTEMIITKSGRRMFPALRCKLSNLPEGSEFVVHLDVEPVDGKRYRYAFHKSAWLAAGKAEPSSCARRKYTHPDSPFTREQLEDRILSFERAKLTNNERSKNGQITLKSMHRYRLRLNLEGRNMQGQKITKSFLFQETEFTAVTAYQNQLVTKLKIERNPFAKGFRQPSGKMWTNHDERSAELIDSEGKDPHSVSPFIRFGTQILSRYQTGTSQEPSRSDYTCSLSEDIDPKIPGPTPSVESPVEMEATRFLWNLGQNQSDFLVPPFAAAFYSKLAANGIWNYGPTVQTSS